MKEKDPETIFKDRALLDAYESIDVVLSLIAVSNTPGEYAAIRCMLSQASGLIQRVRVDDIEGHCEAGVGLPF